MLAFETTTLLPLQLITPIPLPSLPLPLLQLRVPCYSLFRMLTLLKQLRLQPPPCRRPLRQYLLHGCVPGGHCPAQQWLRYCPPHCRLPRGSSSLPSHPWCAAAHRATVRRLVICQNTARCNAATPPAMLCIVRCDATRQDGCPSAAMPPATLPLAALLTVALLRRHDAAHHAAGRHGATGRAAACRAGLCHNATRRLPRRHCDATHRAAICRAALCCKAAHSNALTLHHRPPRCYPIRRAAFCRNPPTR